MQNSRYLKRWKMEGSGLLPESNTLCCYKFDVAIKGYIFFSFAAQWKAPP
jgi:hypothetical protein